MTSVQTQKTRRLGFVPRVELHATAQQSFAELSAILSSVAVEIEGTERQALSSLANWLDTLEDLESFFDGAAVRYLEAYRKCSSDRQSVKLRFEGCTCVLRMDTTFAAELVVGDAAQLAVWGSGEDLLKHVGASDGVWTKGQRSSTGPQPLRQLLLGTTAAVGQYDSFD